MTYSIDLRERVVAFVSKGGSKVEACERFGVARSTVYEWLNMPDLTPKVHGPRFRKLDREALRRHVRDYPDALIRERAVHFGLSQTAMWYGLKQLRLSVKKNTAVPGKKRREKNRLSAKAARHRS